MVVSGEMPRPRAPHMFGLITAAVLFCALLLLSSLQGSKSFFSEIIASISDISFSRDGRYVLSRDYMNLKLWDMAMEARPVVTLPVHEELRPRVSQGGEQQNRSYHAQLVRSTTCTAASLATEQAAGTCRVMCMTSTSCCAGVPLCG